MTSDSSDRGDALRDLSRRFPDGSINIFDRELRYLLAEGDGLTQVGLSPSMLVGKRLRDLFPADSVAYVESFYGRAFEGESVQFELTVFGRTYRISADPLTGKPVAAIVAIARDVTAISATAEVLTREADERDQTLRRSEPVILTADDFLAVMAHELRQPLQACLGALALMRMRHSREAGSRARETVERQILQMSRIVSNVIDAAQLGRGKLPLDRRITDVCEVLHQAVDVIRSADRIPGRFVLSCPDHPVLALIDRSRIEQVFVNLLSNAARYTPNEGTIAVSLIVRLEGLQITVRDTGIGIDPEDLPYIFDALSRGRRIAGKGLGIGLTLAKRITERHGGTISAFSGGLGAGAEFRITLPFGSESPTSIGSTG